MKILCIGRNYSEHAKELNNPVPSEPVFFMKPDTALLKDNAPFYHPDFSNDIHHELELVLRIGKAGKHIDPDHALSYVDGITVGIDFTARDLQQQCKEKGLPWEKAKAFDGSAPIGRFLPVGNLLNEHPIAFELQVNNKVRQSGSSADMLFDFKSIIAYVSKFVTLKTGDLIYTGTPSGVSAIQIGDRLTGSLNGEVLIDFEVK